VKTTYVLDSSALIRYIDDEAGADRVSAVLKACVSGQASVYISALQWGEVAGNLHKRLEATRARRILDSLLPSEVEIVSATPDRAVRAALHKVEKKIAFADAFALELAMESKDRVLLTADYGFKAVEEAIRIEFLPAK
jgi:predicted nucleic acid-binding protein